MTKPHTSYLICAVQRSGSSLLMEALHNTGLGGNPQEYFLGPQEYTPSWEDSAWAKANQADTRREFLDLVLRTGTTPNGVFSCKIMWNYFPEIRRKMAEMPEYRSLHIHSAFQDIFPNLHYIWIIRRDQVRQAVSWAKAAKTGVYAVTKEEPPAQSRPAEFDLEFVTNLHRLVIEGEKGWQAYFNEINVRPWIVYYEDLVQAFEETAKEILRFLEVPFPENLQFRERRLQKQTDATNEDWVRRYLEACAG